MDIRLSTLSGELREVVQLGIEANTRNLSGVMANGELSYDEKDIALRCIDAQTFMLDVVARLAAADTIAAALDRQNESFKAAAEAAKTGPEG